MTARCVQLETGVPVSAQVCGWENQESCNEPESIKAANFTFAWHLISSSHQVENQYQKFYVYQEGDLEWTIGLPHPIPA